MAAGAETREARQAGGESARARDKRRQIREAARTLFLQHGFEGTSMDAITAAAGVSKRTLYKYYSSKEALLGDMVHQITVGRGTSLPVPVDRLSFTGPEDLEATLVRIGTAIVERHREPEFFGLLRVIIAESPRFPQLADQFYEAVIAPGLAFLSAVIDRARECGVVKASDTAAATRLFMGAIMIATYNNGLLTNGRTGWLTPDELRAQVRLLVAAIT